MSLTKTGHCFMAWPYARVSRVMAELEGQSPWCCWLGSGPRSPSCLLGIRRETLVKTPESAETTQKASVAGDGRP